MKVQSWVNRPGSLALFHSPSSLSLSLSLSHTHTHTHTHLSHLSLLQPRWRLKVSHPRKCLHHVRHKPQPSGNCMIHVNSQLLQCLSFFFFRRPFRYEKWNFGRLFGSTYEEIAVPQLTPLYEYYVLSPAWRKLCNWLK